MLFFCSDALPVMALTGRGRMDEFCSSDLSGKYGSERYGWLVVVEYLLSSLSLYQHDMQMPLFPPLE